MEQIRQWMTAMTGACLVSGIVKMLAGEKSKAAVINLVAVLYILLSVIKPALSGTPIALSGVTAESAVPETYPDARQLAAEQAARQLETQFAQECLQEGFEARLTVELTETNGEYKPARICISAEEANRERALELAQNWFGADAEIAVEAKENEDE